MWQAAVNFALIHSLISRPLPEVGDSLPAMRVYRVHLPVEAPSKWSGNVFATRAACKTVEALFASCQRFLASSRGFFPTLVFSRAQYRTVLGVNAHTHSRYTADKMDHSLVGLPFATRNHYCNRSFSLSLDHRRGCLNYGL